MQAINIRLLTTIFLNFILNPKCRKKEKKKVKEKEK
jgi:hypothetical protein